MSERRDEIQNEVERKILAAARANRRRLEAEREQSVAAGDAESPDADQDATRVSDPPVVPVVRDGGNDAEVVHLNLTDVIDSPYQPRKRRLDRREVEDLTRSIAAAGQVSPIIVSPVGEAQPDKYHVHSGHRRCAALRYLDAKQVVAIVRRDLSDRDARRLALADNIGREDLSAYEQAMALQSYCEEYDLTVKDGAVDLGIRLRTAARLRTIAECKSEPLLDVLRDSNVAAKAAEFLVKIDKRQPTKSVRLAKKWVGQKITQRGLEEELQKCGVRRTPVPVQRDVILKADDKGVQLKVCVAHSTRVAAQDEKIRRTLSEFLWHLGIPSVDAAAPSTGGVA